MNLNPFVVIKRYGITNTMVRTAKYIGRATAVLGYHRIRCRNADQYHDPTPSELVWIEQDLNNVGIVTNDLYVDIDDLKLFKSQLPFPCDYHGGG